MICSDRNTEVAELWRHPTEGRNLSQRRIVVG